MAEQKILRFDLLPSEAHAVLRAIGHGCDHPSLDARDKMIATAAKRIVALARLQLGDNAVTKELMATAAERILREAR